MPQKWQIHNIYFVPTHGCMLCLNFFCLTPFKENDWLLGEDGILNWLFDWMYVEVFIQISKWIFNGFVKLEFLKFNFEDSSNF